MVANQQAQPGGGNHAVPDSESVESITVIGSRCRSPCFPRISRCGGHGKVSYRFNSGLHGYWGAAASPGDHALAAAIQSELHRHQYDRQHYGGNKSNAIMKPVASVRIMGIAVIFSELLPLRAYLQCATKRHSAFGPDDCLSASNRYQTIRRIDRPDHLSKLAGGQ
jgi:hypothetical protein